VTSSTQVGLWGRLNLRWQAAIAILVPCITVALFSSLYFPARLNAQAEDSLEARARALGALASAEIAPTLRLINDGLSQPEDLDNIFEGSAGGRKTTGQLASRPGEAKSEIHLEGSDIEYIGVLRAAGTKGVGLPCVPTPDECVPTAYCEQQSLRCTVLPDGVAQKVSATVATVIRKSGNLPLNPLAIPRGGCELDRGKTLVLRCLVQDGESSGLFIAAFRKDALLLAQRENLYVGIWSGIGAAIMALLLAFFFSRALSDPVALVTQAAREVAGGDVTVEPVEVSAAGEIRSMANSFNEMLGNLRALVGQMVSLSGRLSLASEGLIGASQDQEHVTSQQAAYAQEIAATFEELSRTAEQISASTEVVETAARNTNEAVEQAKQVVAQVTAGISDIRDESKQVAEAILKLNADLQQVSKIAQVINAVAERSDLLALNAALEGTKAGEVGRGFSLVAAEMRKLAENVSASARDIGRIVEKVHESGNEAVVKARQGVATSDKGVQVAQQVSEVFQRIVELARGTTEAAQQIAVATRQQRQSSEQAVMGARNVADLVKQGVDATGRTNRIAQDLQSVSHALSEVTGKFRVTREQPVRAAAEPPIRRGS
jgi:methyl-accepting chemotaxis protein